MACRGVFLTPPPCGHPLKRGKPTGRWPTGPKFCIASRLPPKGARGFLKTPIGTNRHKKSKANHFGLSWIKGMGKHGTEIYPPLYYIDNQ